MTDTELLDEIKAGFGLKNDSELAGFLGVTRTTIHNVRYKNRRLGLRPRFRVLDHIAFLKARGAVESWAEMLTTASLSNKIRSISRGFAKKIANKNIPADAEEVAEKDLIEEAKEAFGCANDDELAEILGVARNTISAVRKGDTSLGPEPRLRLLNKIEPFEIEQLQEVLTDTDKLIEAIRIWAASRKN